MPFSHCTEMGLGQVQEVGPELMGLNILCRIIHIGLRQGQEP